MTAGYTAVVQQDGEWWIGWVEEVSGVNSQGQTRDELLENLRDALEDVLELNQGDAVAAVSMLSQSCDSADNPARVSFVVGPANGISMDTTAAQNRLAAIVRQLAVEKRAELDKHKANHADLERPDFLWHYLLQSFATMGRSAGWAGLIGNQANYRRVTYAAIEALPDSDRLAELKTVCRAAKIRMPDRKAEFILGCFACVRDMGGPEAAKAQLLAQPGREGKIRFLKALPGIGDKYARNIMMDVYHEDFRDSIAVDVRIKAVSERLGVSFKSYPAEEAFYLEVARLANVNGWELDRLLYNFRSEVESLLGASKTIPC